MKEMNFTTAILLLTISTAFAQKVKESEVPKAVIASFQSSFKGAKAEKWEKEKDGGYEAEFDWNKAETSASFSADGKLKETEREIKISELPGPAHEYITKNYAGHKITEAAKITSADGKVTFEAEVKKNKEEIDLIFDENGNFLKKEAESGDKED